MQGLFVEGRRPKSKKEVREAIAEGRSVRIEATSLFGNEYDGPVTEMPDGTINFVGPDPYTSRKFYGNLVKEGERITVK